MKIDAHVQSRTESSLISGGAASCNIQLVILPVDAKGMPSGNINIGFPPSSVDLYQGIKTGSKVTLTIEPTA